MGRLIGRIPHGEPNRAKHVDFSSTFVNSQHQSHIFNLLHHARCFLTYWLQYWQEERSHIFIFIIVFAVLLHITFSFLSLLQEQQVYTVFGFKTLVYFFILLAFQSYFYIWRCCPKDNHQGVVDGQEGAFSYIYIYIFQHSHHRSLNLERFKPAYHILYQLIGPANHWEDPDPSPASHPQFQLS